MTASPIELTASADDHRIARYAAAAIALSVVEAAIPMPLPGVKPGLANIITLIVLARYGWRDAVWVSLLRVVAGSLLLGQFLAPGFFLSLAGALASLLALGLALHLPARAFGPVRTLAARGRPSAKGTVSGPTRRSCRETATYRGSAASAARRSTLPGIRNDGRSPPK